MRLERIFTHRLIRVLRLILPILVITLIAIPSWNYWSRRSEPARPVRIAGLPKDIAVVTEDFTFSRTEGGRTLFSIRAKTNLGFKDNKNMLEDVEVTVYGQNEKEPARRIRSKYCNYDEPTGNIRFDENVEVQLDERTAGRTDELVYNHQGRIITSTRRVFLEQPGRMTGEADRLEYEIPTGVLALAGDVRIRTKDGATLDAGSAVFHQKENWVTVADGVFLQSATGWVRGPNGRADLEPGSFAPRVILIEGGVTAESRPPNAEQSWKLRAASLETIVSTGGNAERVRARGDVELQKIGGDSTQLLTGGEVDASLDSAGQVQILEARQNARMILGSDRTLRSSQIFTNAAGAVATQTDSILQMGDSFIEGRDFTIQQGDTVVFSTPHRANLRSGTRRTSADRTEARFDSRTNRLVELVQIGNFQFEEGDRRGRSSQARFEEDGNIVTLEGAPAVSDSKMRLEAGRIRLNQKDDSFFATASVKTITKNSEEPVLVTADRAEGTAGKITYISNVHMVRGNADIRSERLVLSSADNTLHAEGKVRSNLDAIRATSDKLDYDDKQQLAHYTGNVRAQKQDMILECRDVTVKVENGAASEIMARGNVVLTQRDRRGTGEQAVYDGRTESVVLTGKNAEIYDKQRGATRGSRIVMSTKGDKVTVEGEGGSRAVTERQVKR